MDTITGTVIRKTDMGKTILLIIAGDEGVTNVRAAKADLSYKMETVRKCQPGDTVSVSVCPPDDEELLYGMRIARDFWLGV